jgi:hypothetical protein
MSLFSEHHFSVGELGALWSLSPDAIRRLFRDEPGVLVVSQPKTKRLQRKYTTLRIPESVVKRVHTRMTTPERLR